MLSHIYVRQESIPGYTVQEPRDKHHFDIQCDGARYIKKKMNETILFIESFVTITCLRENLEPLTI